MSSNRRPWYKWYPKDFRTDEKVQCLSPLAELVYRRLLDVMWQNSACLLPNVCLKLANASATGLTPDEFEKCWKEIQTEGFELFKITDDGNWIYSKRLREQLQEVNNKQKAGKKGGKASAKQRGKQISSRSQAEVKQKSSNIDTDTDTDLALPNGKAAEEPAALPEKLPLPGSKHFSSRLPDAEAVISKCRELQKLCINNNKFNPFQFVQQCAIKNKHPCAITDALDGLLKMWPEIDDPWPYANAIIKTKSGNYHEAEHKTQTEAFKSEWARIAKQFFR